jgi:Uma2 family endonuclease
MAVATTSRPVLESGDRLTREEFHRRYCERPDIKKAELVEGVVYVASPLRSNVHAEPHGSIITWLGTYKARVPGLRLSDNATVLLDPDNEVQPDASLWHEETAGPRLNERGYIEGAPQLVVEVAASSASYDLHDKKEAYRRNGVREYVVWRVLDGMIDWFRLREGEYIWVEPDQDSVVESPAFPSLRLHLAKMVAGDLAGVLAELEPRPSEEQPERRV